jgi:hypothetical protein
MRNRNVLPASLLMASAMAFAGQGPGGPDADDPGVIIERSREATSANWLQVGGTLIGNPILLRRLRDAFSTYTFTQSLRGDAGYNDNPLCVVRDEVYFTFLTGFAGPSLRVSATKPKDGDCAITPGSWSAELQFGLGVKIGQSKSDVARLIGIHDIHDITTIKSQYTVITAGSDLPPTQHVVTVRFEFRENRLVRVDISDKRTTT